MRSICSSGGIGRHAGLKILWAAMSVRVRFPSRAQRHHPLIFSIIYDSNIIIDKIRKKREAQTGPPSDSCVLVFLCRVGACPPIAAVSYFRVGPAAACCGPLVSPAVLSDRACKLASVLSLSYACCRPASILTRLEFWSTSIEFWLMRLSIVRSAELFISWTIPS